MAVRRVMTAEELFRYGPENKTVELIRGRMIVREPPGQPHGLCAANLCRIVGNFVHEHRLGALYAQDTGFHIEHDPDTVLGPDLAFVRRERVSPEDERPYGDGAPDLIAEIRSPSDRRRQMVLKIEQWLAAGVQLAWLIEPKHRRATMYFADGAIVEVPSHGMLNGGQILPGFSCPLASVFES